MEGPGFHPINKFLSVIPLQRAEMPTPSQLSEAAESTYRFFSVNCNANEAILRKITRPEREAVS